ncbi:MAG: Ig-like domain-containing protein [Candidatus Krumholzibacteriia bacterium]
MPRLTTRARTRFALTWLAGLTVTVLVAASGGCDKTDTDWAQPIAPQPQGDPDLALTVAYQPAADDHVNVGEPVGYTVTLTNSGQGPADSVLVAVTLPLQVSLDQAQADLGSFDPADGRWTVGRIAAASTAILTLEATVADGTVGEELEFSAAIMAMAPADTTPDDNASSTRFTVVNNPPTAGDDAYTVSEGATLSVPAPGLLSNDLDNAGEAITLQTQPVSGPFLGLLTIQPSGAFAYINDGSEAVADSFRYVITDASAESDTAWVRLTIEPVNDAPVIDAPVSYVIAEGGVFAPIALDPLVQDDDDADATLQWFILGADALAVSVSSDRILTVTTPGPDWYGSDSLIFRVRDPHNAVANADVVFSVTSVNDPPVVAVLPNQSVPVGGEFLAIPLDNYVSDVDHTDAQMTWTYSGQGVLLVSISPARVLTVQPPSDTWTGSVTMTLRATDPEGAWAERTCRFEVTASK